ncbi:carbohydrate binding domain-containing protein [Lutibacter sp. HS1-25]|uniref:carbohydrate binding domain-containing protein n=1 Tax=Lutibacter sp. HS1-25 TaxID=2485000 RepID=UPI0013E9834E|nr:carbohydrate binding domain-containing protein [Lutibacter sp. HS1-25]
MKTYKYILSVVLFITAVISCTQDEFGSLDFVDTAVAPKNVTALFSVTQDNTGTVTIAPNSEGAVSYDVYPGDATTEFVKVAQGKSLKHVYAEGNYNVKIVATGITGLKTESTLPLVVSFKAPENLVAEILNDPTVSKKVNVTVTADYATSFEVYFGEEGNDEPVPANIGETASYVYQEAGTYSIRVVAKSAAIETTEYTEEFEVTEILQPLVKAPTPPARNAADVISMFSDKYTQTTVDMFVTDWSVVALQEEITIQDNKTLVYRELSYAGIITEVEPMNASGMEFFHFDVWSTNVETFKVKFVDFNGTGWNNGSDNIEFEVERAITEEGKWMSFDIPLSDFEGVPFSDINQMVISALPVGTVFLDNMYFYKMSDEQFDGGFVINGDFESGAEPWTIGVGTDPVPLATTGGNTYYSVNVANAGNPWEVNMSQKLEIINGATYTLSFDAWSDTDRPILPGIGLSADPWTNVTQEVNITTTKQTYTITLTANAGASDARVFFDLGAAAGAVNIDNVSLFLENLVTNGDFENGAEPWTIGVGTDPVPLATTGGNTYYSVNVANAGNPWEVNMSQKLEIINGTTYTLSFDAWSDTDRPILPGIGLSADPWTNVTQEVSITTTKQTYEITLTANAGASDARVFFDLGAAAGAVNIDNVSLFIKN